MKKQWIIVVCLLAITLAWVPSSLAKTLVVNQGTASIVRLDPHVERSSTALNFLASTIYDTILMHDMNMAIKPMLATSWESSSGGTVWTVNLRKGVTFSDGTPLDAEAVKFNFDRITDPKTKAVRGTYFSSLVKSIDIINSHSIKFTLKFNYAPFAAALTMPDTSIVSPAAVKKYGKDFSTHPVGTGPFVLKEFKREKHVILERNANYWMGTPKIEKIRITQIRESSTVYAALKSGEIDVEILPRAEYLDDFEKDPNLNLDRGGPKLFFEYFGFNNGRPPFNEKKIRRAVAHAINTEAIVKHVDGAYGKYICQPLGSTVWGYDPSIKCIEYNPEKAKGMLAEAGWKPGSDGILEKEGKKFIVEAKIIAPQLRRFEAIQSDLKKVGIEVKIKSLEWGAFLSSVVKGEYDLFNLGRDHKSGDADAELFSLFHSSNIPAVNLARYSNPEVDRLLELQRSEGDREKRLELIQQILKIITDDVPLIPTMVRMTNTVSNKRIKNLAIYPDDRMNYLNITVD